MMLFRSVEHIDRWCQQMSINIGAIIELEKAFELAQIWHGDKLSNNWRRRTIAETQAVFSQLGFNSAFWRLA